MSDRKNQISVHLESIRLVVAVIFLSIPSILWAVVKFFIPRQEKDVAEQLALITGGSEGIGRAVAIELAKKGCKIAIANRNFEKGLKTAEEIRRKYNVEVNAFRCDVGNREDVKKLYMEVKSSLGVVDILVNNAGLMPLKNSLLEGDDDQYQYCMDVNMTSWIWTTRAFLPDMIKQKRGHIIGVSSLSAVCPIQNMVTYVATKHANSGFMEALRAEMCFYGFEDFIKTSTVYMGFVKTNDDMFELINSNFLEPLFFFCDANKVGKTIVKGILKNYETIHASFAEFLMCKFLNYLPRKLQKFIMRNALRSSKRNEYIRNRLEECKF